MNFPFDNVKAVQAACQFIRRDGGRINVMKLVKLLYLLDRLSLERRDVPVIGGRYYSMRNGPVMSEVLDLINSGKLFGEKESIWEGFITDRENHEVGLRVGDIPTDELSEAELDLIEEIWTEHGGKNQWELSQWCHENCAEWRPLDESREIISLGDIGRALGLSGERVEEMDACAQEDRFIARALSSPNPVPTR